mmetsp:Transcript_6748/g.10849  ORF Transcript_6748/g.10849 Transcript_6748/m.10849 type:complete len:99 (+) Transcript_6748:1742-2038(+)
MRMDNILSTNRASRHHEFSLPFLDEESSKRHVTDTNELTLNSSDSSFDHLRHGLSIRQISGSPKKNYNQQLQVTIKPEEGDKAKPSPKKKSTKEMLKK